MKNIKGYVGKISDEYQLLYSVLEDFGFSFDLVDRLEFCELLGDIKESDTLREKVDNIDIRPLAKISPRIFANGLISMADGADMSDYVLPLAADAYDKDVSMVYTPKMSPEGFFLVRVAEPEVLQRGYFIL